MAASYKTFNDLGIMFDKGPTKTETGYACPVCDKSYRYKEAAGKHVDERDCYSLRQQFENTTHELAGYKLYSNLSLAIYNKTPMNGNVFRKSKIYNSVIRLVMFLNINSSMKYSELYVSWLYHSKKFTKINKLFSESLKESNLREFRLYLQRYDFIESEQYYNIHKDKMMEDGLFFIRAIETAQVSLKYILSHPTFDFDKRMATLEPDYVMRFVDFSNAVLTDGAEV